MVAPQAVVASFFENRIHFLVLKVKHEQIILTVLFRQNSFVFQKPGNSLFLPFHLSAKGERVNLGLFSEVILC